MYILEIDPVVNISNYPFMNRPLCKSVNFLNIKTENNISIIITVDTDVFIYN